MAVVAWNPTNPASDPTMVGPWIVLPQGIAIFPNSLASLPSANAVSVRVLATPLTANCPAVVFQSDGALAEGFSPLPTNGVAFFEGKVENNMASKTSRMTNFETVRLTRYTGRAMATVAPEP